MQVFTKLPQYGRSMIEMLGVLAVIGVLSAGGIWGYNQAMDAFTFNKFVKDMQTMVGAAISVFPEPPKQDQSYNVPMLNRLGVISDDLYKKSNGTYLKNPFTNKMDWAVYILEQILSSAMTRETNIGNYTISAGRQTALASSLTVPKKVCVKILTFNWNEIAPAWYDVRNSTYNYYYLIVKPLTTAEAETICNYESNHMQFNFRITASSHSIQ